MKPQNVTCPECGGEMVSRLNRRDNSRFWGCQKYPECKGTRSVDGEERKPRCAIQYTDEAGTTHDVSPSQSWRERDKSRWRS